MKPLNIGLSSAWKKATNRENLWSVVAMATLKKNMPWEEEEVEVVTHCRVTSYLLGWYCLWLPVSTYLYIHFGTTLGYGLLLLLLLLKTYIIMMALSQNYMLQDHLTVEDDMVKHVVPIFTPSSSPNFCPHSIPLSISPSSSHHNHFSPRPYSTPSSLCHPQPIPASQLSIHKTMPSSHIYFKIYFHIPVYIIKYISFLLFNFFSICQGCVRQH